VPGEGKCAGQARKGCEGLRSVIQWLLWVFGRPETYNTRQGLLSQLPAFVRPKVLKALNDQACFETEYGFKKEGKSVYVLKDDCTMGVPIERDYEGKVLAIFEQWEEDLGLRQVPRLERAEKLGITVAEEEGKEKEEKGEDEEDNEEGGVEMYLRVDHSDSFVVPQMVDIVEGLEKLFFKQKGEFMKISLGWS
jgi:hypothetical protein